MPEEKPAIAIERLASLARAAVEARRFGGKRQADLDDTLREAVSPLEKEERAAAAKSVDPFVVVRGPRPVGGGRRGGGDGEPSRLEQVLKERASLDLSLQTEREARRNVEESLANEQTQHAQARETLSLQQRKIKEWQEERTKLLSDVSQLESQLRKQVNETEQVRLRFEKQKSTRQMMSDQATDHAEQISELQAEIEKLKVQLEQAKRQRDQHVAEANLSVEEATGQTADAAFKALWADMGRELEDVFVDTHVPTRKTFELVCETYIEFLKVLRIQEMHVHQLLKDLRQVGEQSDKLNHFYIMFTKNPGLFETLRDYVTTGKRKGNFINLLRAQQTWSRAFSTGLYKVIVRTPVIAAEEMNTKDWPIKTGFTVSEEAAIGKYYKETAQKTIPEELGTKLRKHAADMSYEDYNDLMKRK